MVRLGRWQSGWSRVLACLKLQQLLEVWELGFRHWRAPPSKLPRSPGPHRSMADRGTTRCHVNNTAEYASASSGRDGTYYMKVQLWVLGILVVLISAWGRVLRKSVSYSRGFPPTYFSRPIQQCPYLEVHRQLWFTVRLRFPYSVGNKGASGMGTCGWRFWDWGDSEDIRSHKKNTYFMYSETPRAISKAAKSFTAHLAYALGLTILNR